MGQVGLKPCTGCFKREFTVNFLFYHGQAMGKNFLNLDFFYETEHLTGFSHLNHPLGEPFTIDNKRILL